jgi:hypothetical protein
VRDLGGAEIPQVAHGPLGEVVDASGGVAFLRATDGLLWTGAVGRRQIWKRRFTLPAGSCQGWLAI